MQCAIHNGNKENPSHSNQQLSKQVSNTVPPPSLDFVGGEREREI